MNQSSKIESLTAFALQQREFEKKWLLIEQRLNELNKELFDAIYKSYVDIVERNNKC